MHIQSTASFVLKCLTFARRHRLNLAADIETVDLREIRSESGIEVPDYMQGAFNRTKHERDAWPKYMPLVMLAGRESLYETLDGNHRIKAARASRYRQIPAIVTSLDSFDALWKKFEEGPDFPHFYFREVIVAAGSEIVRNNLKQTDRMSKLYKLAWDRESQDW